MRRRTAPRLNSRKETTVYNVNGYKIVVYPMRSQPITVWQGSQVVYFCTTEKELEMFISKKPHHAR
jgi:hypothetical protein